MLKLFGLFFVKKIYLIFLFIYLFFFIAFVFGISVFLTITFLLQLLDRSHSSRLGSTGKGFEEMKTHPFFKAINWNHLGKGILEPPFRPNVRWFHLLFSGMHSPNFTHAYLFCSFNNGDQIFLILYCLKKSL